MRLTIRELFDQPGVHLSCEVFPPKVFDKVEEAKAAVRDICALSPAYVSVTCGASGSTPQFTREISAYVQEHGGYGAVPPDLCGRHEGSD